jgi:hypothetical protein
VSRRWIAALVAVALVGALAIAARSVDDASAEIEGGVFTSAEHNVRVSLPRGWRISDQPAFPGVIVRMYRTRPRATILLAVDPLPEAKDLSETCASAPTFAQAVACEHVVELGSLGFNVEPVQVATRPWFDYAGGKRMSRQGIVVLGDRVFTLVMSVDTASARAQYARSFDRALRSIRLAGAVTTADGGVVVAPEVVDGGTGAAPQDAGP